MEIETVDGIVPAIFTSRAQAEAAIADLRSLGFDDDDLGLIVPDPAHYHLLDDSDTEALHGLTRGVLIGVPVGTLAGIGLMLLAVPGLGPIGLGGMLLLGAYGGALWGAIIGAEFGLDAKIKHITDIERQYDISLQRDEILVAVLAEDRAPAVCDILRRHGARCIKERMADPAPAHG